MAPTVLVNTISFLDAMDTSEYLPILIEIFVYFSEHYQNLFGQQFKVGLISVIIINCVLKRYIEGCH